MTIQCSCCGKKHAFPYSAENVLRVVCTLGWGSFGSVLYCPECSDSWEGKSRGRPQADPAYTIRVIDCLYQSERGPYRRKPEEGV